MWNLFYALAFFLGLALVAGEDVYCPSLPQSIVSQYNFFPNNDQTDSCALCTKYSFCSWCDSGEITNIQVLGVAFNDIVANGFCWQGNPFKLENNTFSVTTDSLESSFTITCNGIPKWRQCKISGTAAVVLVFIAVAIALVCCCGCACCCLCRRHKHHGYIQM